MLLTRRPVEYESAADDATSSKSKSARQPVIGGTAEGATRHPTLLTRRPVEYESAADDRGEQFGPGQRRGMSAAQR